MESLLHDMDWVSGVRSDTLTPVFQLFTWLGYTMFFLIALPLGYWVWDKNRFTRLAILIFISALLNSFLKDLWQDPRPDRSLWLDQGPGESFGMPSGHAQIGIVMWFWLAYEMRNAWAYAAAAVIAAGIAFSRLYLGVHDVEDVLVGVLLGVSSLGLYWWFLTDRFERLHALPTMVRLGILALALTLAFALWPDGVGAAASIGGFLIVWMAGAAYDGTSIRYKPPVQWWRLLVASVVGVSGMIYLSEALPALVAAVAPESVLLVTAQGAVLGLYVTVIAPRAFQMLKLAPERDR